MKRITYHIPFTTLAILLGFSFLMASCAKEDEVIVVQDFDLPPYDTIELDAVFDVDLIESDTFSLHVSGVKEVIEDLTYKVENEKLIIDNSSSKLWLHPKNNPPKLVITGKGLTRIDVMETCDINSINTITTETFGIILGGKLNIANLLLNCKSFYYWNSSPAGGKLTLRGTTNTIQIYNGTLMAVDASQFPCDYATVENGSKSDIHVFVRKKLDYSISGVGDIYLSGNPDEIVAGHLSSTGRLVH